MTLQGSGNMILIVYMILERDRNTSASQKEKLK